MWKDYSLSYIKNNRASSISIIVAALIASLFLSFLCSLFYNLWVYEVEAVKTEEGDWQGRITGNISGDDLLTIQNFGNVKWAAVNEELSVGAETVVDIVFHNNRTIYRDMPLLIKQLGLKEEAASCHELLLSKYLIHDPQDESPPLLMTFYLIILIMVCLSMILIIRNSFAMSMNARIHQFGIFSSVGATPGQIRICLLQEAAILCLAPVLLGTLLGIALSFGAGAAMNSIAEGLPGRHELAFHYHPLVLAATILSSLLTVLFSAWLPAWKLSKITPLEAIRNIGNLHLKKKRRSPLLSLLFGIEGELAGNALKAQKKAFCTSTLSLTLSFLGFTLILCFFTLSGISTNHTYFEKYQDVWDVMVTLKNTKIENFHLTPDLQGLTGAQDCIVYQKTEAISLIPEEAISGELTALGGPGAIAGDSAVHTKDGWLLRSPVIILDDASFASYCKQLGITPRIDGTIILNQIWDRLYSNFRYPDYVPYLEEGRKTILLLKPEQTGVEVPVTAYTRQVPILREEYKKDSLTQFIPLSLWKKLSGRLGSAEPETYVRLLAKNRNSLEQLDDLEADAIRLLCQNYEIETENRIQEKITNDYMIWGYQMILGGLCALLALIGIANVFSNTLGFLRQRKREFAQYMSVGMTPAGLRKMFILEALVIAGRPLFITLPLTVAAMGFLIKASYLDPIEFIVAAPVLPILAFCLVIFIFVGLAYYIGGRRVLQCSLSEALRDDTA